MKFPLSAFITQFIRLNDATVSHFLILTHDKSSLLDGRTIHHVYVLKVQKMNEKR